MSTVSTKPVAGVCLAWSSKPGQAYGARPRGEGASGGTGGHRGHGGGSSAPWQGPGVLPRVGGSQEASEQRKDRS